MKKEPISGKAAGVVFLAIGLLLIAFAVFMQKVDRDFYGSAILSPGVVTKTELRDKNATNNRLRVYYSFEVNGVEYRNSDDGIGSGMAGLTSGDAVDVLYAPDNPERSELAMDRPGPPWIFYILGIACVFVGVMGLRHRGQ